MAGYDNTKLLHAFSEWLKSDIERGDDHNSYARDLLEGFVAFAIEKKLMRRSPGPVVFGRLLAKEGFTKSVAAGLTYWHGLRIKPDVLAPRGIVPGESRKAAVNAEIDRQQREEEAKTTVKVDTASRKDQVRQAMLEETREKLAGVDPN